MTSPAPYAEAKRMVTNRLKVRFAVKPGEYVYAPAGGMVSVRGNSVYVTTSAGWTHRLVNVRVRSKKLHKKVEDWEFLVPTMNTRSADRRTSSPPGVFAKIPTTPIARG